MRQEPVSATRFNPCESHLGGGFGRDGRLPFSIGLIADFAGDARRKPVSERRFLNIDINNINDVIKHLSVGLKLQIAVGSEEVEYELQFRSLADFGPENILASNVATKRLLSLRESLFQAIQLMQKQCSQFASTTATPPAIQDLVNQGEISSLESQAEESIAKWIEQLSRSPSNEFCIQASLRLVRLIDRWLCKQVDAVLENIKFKSLEATWRSVFELVAAGGDDKHIRICLLDSSMEEFTEDIAQGRGKSTIWQKVSFELKIQGGMPFSMLVADYEFDVSSASHVAILNDAAELASNCNSVFISALNANSFGLDSYEQLTLPRDLPAILESNQFATWHELRANPNSACLGLTCPRIKLPHESRWKSAHIGSFVFESPKQGLSDGLICNAAYGLAIAIVKPEQVSGWPIECEGIDHGKMGSKEPACYRSSDGNFLSTECALSTRRIHELERVGFIPVVHDFATNTPFIWSTHSVHSNSQAGFQSRNLQPNLNLKYRIIAARFVHAATVYLALHSSSNSGDEPAMELGEHLGILNSWIAQFVAPEDDSVCLQRPLRRGEISVMCDERNRKFLSLAIEPAYKFPSDARFEFRIPVELM